MSDPVSNCPKHGEYSLHTGCFGCESDTTPASGWGPPLAMRDLRAAYNKLLPTAIAFADKVSTLSMTEDRESIYECHTTIDQMQHLWNHPDLKAIRLRKGHLFYTDTLIASDQFPLYAVGKDGVAVISRAEHDKRVSELLAANNVEVERRREAERELKLNGSAIPHLQPDEPVELSFTLETGKLHHNYTIPMILYCPNCGERHIDGQAFAEVAHHTHACQGCGNVWRPAKVNTHGVQFLPGYRNQSDYEIV